MGGEKTNTDVGTKTERGWRPRSGASRRRAQRSGCQRRETGGHAGPPAGGEGEAASVHGAVQARDPPGSGCTGSGEIGALLRRKGLYTSHLSMWRKQREQGALGALGRRRGRKKADPLRTENEKLRRKLDRTEAELAKARKVIEVQGNVSALFGELLQAESGRSKRSSDE